MKKRAYRSGVLQCRMNRSQNRPGNPVYYTAEEERDFIKEYLGPTLKSQGMGDKKLIAWDHNRDLVYQRASTILNDPEAAKYVWGIGFHWYETLDRKRHVVRQCKKSS